jgi:hypothetical protein
MANKYMKKCLTSSAIKEIQIKTALRFQLTPVRLAGDNVGSRAFTLLVGM